MEAVVSSSPCPCCSFLLILFPCSSVSFPCVLLPQGAVLQEKAAPAWVPRLQSLQGSCQEPDPVWASPRVRASSGNFLLFHHGLLPRLQADLCSTVDPHGLQGISALAPGAPPASPSSLPSCLQGCCSPMFPLLSLAAAALTLTKLFLPS